MMKDFEIPLCWYLPLHHGDYIQYQYKYQQFRQEGIFVNNESTSRLPTRRELSCSTISLAKQKLYLTVNSLDVIEFILGTKNLAILYDGIPVAEVMGLKVGHLSTMFLCTLRRPYKIPGLELAALIFLCCSTLKASDDFKDFKYSLIRLSWFV